MLEAFIVLNLGIIAATPYAFHGMNLFLEQLVRWLNFHSESSLLVMNINDFVNLPKRACVEEAPNVVTT